MSQHPAYTIGGLAALGGTIGYLRRGSRPSLIAGWTLGSLFVLSGYLIQTNGNYGFELATASSALMLAAMAPRAMKSLAPVPLGLMTLGLASSVYYGRKLAAYY
ncbi:hypothetical protein CXG81DRAFT_23801 [Caulochytrium protostelioides]|uniref:TMEM14-domain-containing protein n=1 Tax=Caulochytrium protostelioides TaxID=1555241 RepID=A0A4P9XEF9_9FUNG|nr:hypothetical protein CXG81DRAFT_23801 [Caulochytrium protostelioides]|eukprot:RKP03540.1 hypothetical protein CXG81DRAFT_23801 [Caulochytrium protostelioides]